VTEFHELSAGDAWDVHVTASGEVMTRFPVPVKETATKRLFLKATELHALSAADDREVHVIPLGDVMTRFPMPELDTATKRLFP